MLDLRQNLLGPIFNFIHILRPPLLQEISHDSENSGKLLVPDLACSQVEAGLPTPQVPQVGGWSHWQCVKGHCHSVRVRVID